jgi:alkanesulfonate monooxygenase SsuD/methylene tetrahydromethanopterin reductase-like flavin-dependent oxidoreductase (luciferase family)
LDFSVFLDLRARQGAPMTAAEFEEFVQLVKAAEQLGFHTVWTSEQHGVDDGYLPAQLPVLAAFARETRTLRLGTGVILLPLTHPRRVIEEACVVDVISNGRLSLGLGAGNYPNEFRIFGVDRRQRKQLMEEGVAFIKAGLSGGRLPDGSWVNIPPVQRPIPLVLGGLVEPAIDRAVRLADGHFAYCFGEPETELAAMYRQLIVPALQRHERAPSSLRLLFASVVWQSDNAEQEWRDVVGPAFAYEQRKYLEWEEGVPSAGGYAMGDPSEARRRLFVGSADELAERLTRLRHSYPFDEVVFWARLPGVPFALALEHLERLSTGVMKLVAAKGAVHAGR